MKRLLGHARLMFLIALGLGALVAAPRQAHASPEFPRSITDHLLLPQDPPCSVCHAGNVTTNDTVFTPFGRSMRLHGLAVEDDASLIRALDALDRDGVDSDHDGVGDIDELMAGTLPNTPPSLPPPPDWKFGCAVGSAGGSATTSGSVLAAVGVLLALRGARRRKRARG